MAKRQIVFLMTDTTRSDMIGAYGNKDMKTPNLDRLASQGIRFDRAYTTQPVCGPARSCIFTGLYPHGTGSFTNSVPLWQGVKTIGEYLTPKGIHTAYIGKWHLDGGDYFGNGECPPGYDSTYWYDMRNFLQELSTEERMENRKKLSAGGKEVKEESTFAHNVVDRALDFIEKNKDRDFFLTVSLDEPHGPYRCPEPYASMYKDYRWPVTPDMKDTLKDKPKAELLWASGREKEDKENINITPSGLLGCNSYADYELGRVIDKVNQCAKDAMVVYTSDHGDALDSHSLNIKGPSVYDAVAKIPLIIRGGSYMPTKEGGVYPHVASHVDLVPTFLDYFGLEIPPYLHGVSMRKAIENPSSGGYRPWAMVEFHRYEVDHDGFGGLQLMRGLVGDRYKLCEFLLDSDEFFDNEKDPYELENLIEDEGYREIRDKMHDALMEEMNAKRDPFRGYQWRYRYWCPEDRSDWECDGYTRQRPSGVGEIKQLDYETGLEITEYVRPKKKHGQAT